MVAYTRRKEVTTAVAGHFTGGSCIKPTDVYMMDNEMYYGKGEYDPNSKKPMLGKLDVDAIAIGIMTLIATVSTALYICK